jgi:UDP-N-acetylmuramoylalanine--D-glutamate ligase
MIKLTTTSGKNIGIFGLARTGFATYAVLKSQANAICFDDNESNRRNFIETFGTSAIVDIDDPRWTKLDYIVLSPGVPLHFPEPHKIVNIANTYSIPLIADIELLFRELPEKTYIGITGTNGKSTTTALIGHILGKSFNVGGNIGHPVFGLEGDTDGFVLELSSYQLDLLHDFKPQVAALLNITPDHIERHGSFDGYIKAKQRLWKNMRKDDVLVIGIDNDITHEIYKGLQHTAPFKLIPVSAKHDSLQLPYNNFLQGLHNRENALAAYYVAKALGYSNEHILAKIQDFIGLKHRMQFIGRYKNISFYNDSKATNAEAASKSLGSLENIYWIAGGIPKDGGIELLSPLFSRVKKTYLYGEAKNIFAQTLDGKVDFVVCDTMHDAFVIALRDSTASDMDVNILLAPACTSFDQFKDFEERGEEFIKLCSPILH